MEQKDKEALMIKLIPFIGIFLLVVIIAGSIFLSHHIANCERKEEYCYSNVSVHSEMTGEYISGYNQDFCNRCKG